jgi:Tfp pilus assembly protein PilF
MKGVRWVVAILCVALMTGCATGRKSTSEEPPSKAKSYYQQGVSLSEEGNYPAALSALKKAVNAHPGYGDAYYNMGIVYQNLDRPEEAIEAYQKAAEINPNDAAARNNLGNAYLREDRLSEAILELEAAVKIDPAYALAHHNLALAYYLSRMYHRAWDQLRELKLLDVSPEPSLFQAVADALGLEEGDRIKKQ